MVGVSKLNMAEPMGTPCFCVFGNQTNNAISHASLGDADGQFRDRRNRHVAFNHAREAVGCEFEVHIDFVTGEPIHIVTQTAGCVDVDYPEGEHSHPVVSIPSNGQLLLEEVDAIGSDGLYKNALSVLDRS